MRRVGLTVSLLALSGLLILALGGLGASATGTLPSAGASAQAWQPEPNPTVCVEASSTPGGGDLGARRNPAAIGQTIPLSYEGTAFEVTITEVVTGQEATDRILEASRGNEPPPEGKEYVLFYSMVHISRTSNDEAAHVSLGDWVLVDSSGQIMRLTPPLKSIPPEPVLMGDGFEGATIEGWTAMTREIGEQVSLVFDLEPGGTGGAWFAIPGQAQTPANQP